jgi:hypothetical protein
VLATTYGDKVTSFFAGTPVPAEIVDATSNSVGAVPTVVQRLTESGLGEVGAQLQKVADNAFVDAVHWGVSVAALATGIGVVIALMFLPARPRAEDREEQLEEYAEEHTGEFAVPEEDAPALDAQSPFLAPGPGPGPVPVEPER